MKAPLSVFVCIMDSGSVFSIYGPVRWSVAGHLGQGTVSPEERIKDTADGSKTEAMPNNSKIIIIATANRTRPWSHVKDGSDLFVGNALQGRRTFALAAVRTFN